jgi:hypothetical protein
MDKSIQILWKLLVCLWPKGYKFSGNILFAYGQKHTKFSGNFWFAYGQKDTNSLETFGLILSESVQNVRGPPSY